MTEWQPIETAPKDGRHFLAWTVTKADEYDEDVLIKKDVIEQNAVVAYFCFGGFVMYPWSGSFVQNMKFTHWMPLPRPPK